MSMNGMWYEWIQVSTFPFIVNIYYKYTYL